MDREALIKHGLKSLQKLPENRISEAVDFIDFISEKYKDEADLYTVNDLKEKY